MLLLGSCGITSWESVDELAKFPSLVDVRMSDNPVLLDSSMGGRYECIARLSKLAVLNGAVISKRERRCELTDAGHNRACVIVDGLVIKLLTMDYLLVINNL